MEVIVKYDLECDGITYTIEEVGLDSKIQVPDNLDDDEISDWISDKTGWCVLRWWKV